MTINFWFRNSRVDHAFCRTRLPQLQAVPSVVQLQARFYILSSRLRNHSGHYRSDCINLLMPLLQVLQRLQNSVSCWRMNFVWPFTRRRQHVFGSSGSWDPFFNLQWRKRCYGAFDPRHIIITFHPRWPSSRPTLTCARNEILDHSWQFFKSLVS